MNDAELATLSASTIGHYDERAHDFWEGTRDHDVSQNIHALLSALGEAGPYDILDPLRAGARPARLLLVAGTARWDSTGRRFCEMARARSGCTVWHQDFLALDLPPARFDGVFANASLFHVPGQCLPAVLAQLFATLRPGGVLFSSVPRGPGVEGFNGDRYGFYHELEAGRRCTKPPICVRAPLLPACRGSPSRTALAGVDLASSCPICGVIGRRFSRPRGSPFVSDDHSFSADWLRLREPFDHAARSGALAAQLSRMLPDSPRLIELATGLGSGARFVSGHLATPAHWLLVDHDPALLSAAQTTMDAWAAARPECSPQSLSVQALDLRAGFPDAPVMPWSRRPCSISSRSPGSRVWPTGCRPGRCRSSLRSRSMDACTGTPPTRSMPRCRPPFARTSSSTAALAALPARRRPRFWPPSSGPVGSRWSWRRPTGRSQRMRPRCSRSWSRAPPRLPGHAPGSGGSTPWHTQRSRDVAAGRVSLTVGHQDLLAWPLP